MTKKESYKESSLAQIIEKKFVPWNTPECYLKNLGDIAGTDYYTIIPAPMSIDQEVQNRFLKHGPRLDIERRYTKDEAFKSEKPARLMKEAFDRVRHAYSGYTIRPYLGKDTRLRVIPLTSLVLGAKIFGTEEIKVKPYASSKQVESCGAKVSVEVPSTTVGQPNYIFEFGHVPVRNNANKNYLWEQIASNHNCNGKEFKEIGYNLRDSNESYDYIFFCPHQISGYFALINHFLEIGNNIPFEMNPFALPSLATARFNVALQNNVLLEDETVTGEMKLRKPKLADKEWLNWARVSSLGWDETFNAKMSRDGKLRDYKWD